MTKVTCAATMPLTICAVGLLAGRPKQETGIREADRSDDKPIADNLAATLVVLKTLHVTVERFPSA